MRHLDREYKNRHLIHVGGGPRYREKVGHEVETGYAGFDLG